MGRPSKQPESDGYLCHPICRSARLVIQPRSNRATIAFIVREVGTTVRAAMFARVIQSIDPPWLLDADLMIAAADDLPSDAERLARTFGVRPETAFTKILDVQRKVDLDARRRLGLAGELALIAALEARWPNSTVHVSAFDDSAGYDVEFSLPRSTLHIEVKSTFRKGRLTVYVTRNEYATSQRDPNWVLVVVGLDAESNLVAVATVRREVWRHGSQVTRVLGDDGSRLRSILPVAT